VSTRYISLREARSIHFTMRQQLAHGQDPKLVRQAQQLAAANTFALVAEEWLQINREKWVPSHTKTIRQRLNKNILPWLGSRPIGIITPSEILEAIRRIEARGAHETARRCLSSARSNLRPMSNMAMLAALRSLGITQAEMTCHGWRATARTLLDEVLGYLPHLIEHQLGHTVRDPLEKAPSLCFFDERFSCILRLASGFVLEFPWGELGSSYQGSGRWQGFVFARRPAMASRNSKPRLRHPLAPLILASSLAGGVAACSLTSDPPAVTQVPPTISAQVPEIAERGSESIAFYYDGVKTSVTAKDAAVLFAVCTLNTSDPARIVNFVNNTLKVPITDSDVTGLGDPRSPAISDFTGDGRVDCSDAAVLFAVATRGRDAARVNEFVSGTLKVQGVSVTQTRLDSFFSPTPAPTPTPPVTPTPTPAPTPTARPTPTPVTFQLASSAFAPSEPIPSRYTCEGEDLSPPLTWSGAPAGTRSFALIMEDPDAPGGTFVHWVVYNLPASVTSLPEGIRSDSDLPQGAVHGQNSWGRNTYGGPCPPRGPHRYFFTLYALDRQLALAPGATKEALLRAMEGHILAQAQLMGTYQRRGSSG
jgi:Raf kinase inhibitor-like YbhB/YbcL family protein